MGSKKMSFYDDKNIDRERVITNDEKYLPDELICPICLCLLWKPESCAKCENLFCRHCIQTWLDGNALTCPLCRSEYKTKIISVWIQSSLLSLSIYCRNQSFGCKSIASYDRLEQHEQFDCQHRSKTCCLCEKTVRIQEIDQHTNSCKSVVTKCDFCECLIPIDSREYHRNECVRNYQASNEYSMEQFANFANRTILSSTSETNFHGLELFNQTRRNNYVKRLAVTLKWLSINLPMIHLILLNLIMWSAGSLMNTFIEIISLPSAADERYFIVNA
ncbi:unnamed protein product [Adineta ricciae]|uniref:RING-type domain-containing protein n=1 Tax=Adineta ricciae TaxID=249248 RepID=A0A814ULI0_ADIRI|nr:unnamed protein product [Adineta ricciae]